MFLHLLKKIKPLFWKISIPNALFFVFALFSALSVSAHKSIPKSEIVEKQTEFLESSVHRGAVNFVKKSLPAVVLIHTFSDRAEKDHLIHNGALEPRETPDAYDHAVISGTIIHKNGYVVTTYHAIKNSSRIIVSLNSENRQNNADSNMIITSEDYEAKIITEIPALNIAVLKIDSRDGSEFPYVEFGHISDLRNNEDSVIKGCAFIVGKAAGEIFVTPTNYANSKNSFHIIAHPIDRLTMIDVDGASYLNIENTVMDTCMCPENAGGVILDCTGRMLGIPDYSASSQCLFSKYLAIPVDVIKKVVSAAVTTKTATTHEFGSDFEDVLDKTKKFGFLARLFGERKKNSAATVRVKSITKDGLADKSGLLQSDVVLKFNNQDVKDSKSLKNMIARSIIDGSFTLMILRNNRHTIELEFCQ